MGDPIRISNVRPSLEAATELTAAGFVQPWSKELVADVERHLAEGALVQTFTDEQQRSVGFALYAMHQIEDDRVLYAGGIMIHPDYQKQRLAAQAFKQAIRELRPTYFALRTQSSVMWRAGQELFRNGWFPEPSNMLELLPHVRRLGEQVSGRIGCGGKFPHVRAFYGASLYGEKPVHREAWIQAWWDDICWFKEGDAIICLGIVPSSMY